MSSLSKGTWVTLAFVVAFLALRFLFLEADPPPALVSYYQDFAFFPFDEGWWTANAREAVLTGMLLGTGFDLFWVSPFFTILTSVVFSALGVSLAAGRTLSIAMGCLTVFLLARLRDDSQRASRLPVGWGAAGIFVFAFAPAQLLRLSTPESCGITLGMLGATALLTGTRFGHLAAGVCGALAMLTKPHFAFLLPTFALSSVVFALRGERSWWRAALWVAGGGVAILAVWGSYVLAHFSQATSLWSFYLIDRWFAGVPPDLSGLVALVKPTIQVVIAGVIYRHHFFSYLPVVFLLAIVFAPRVWAAALQPRRPLDVPNSVILFGLWTLVGGGLIATMPFQPFRYYLPLLPGIVVLAAWGLGRAFSPGADDTRDARETSNVESVLTWGLSCVALVQIAFATLSWLPSVLMERGNGHVELLNPEEFRMTAFLMEVARSRSLAPFETIPKELAHLAATALCGVAALASGCLLAVGFAGPLARGGLRRWLGVAPRLLVVVFILWHGVHWVRWQPEYTLSAMTKEIDRVVAADQTISPAGSFALDSQRRFDSSAVLGGDMYDAEGGTDYFVALVSHPLIGRLPEGEIERRFEGTKREARFHLSGDYVYDLYRAAPPATERRTGFSASP